MVVDSVTIYFARAKEIARFYAVPNTINHAAADYDDFVSELAIKGWQAWQYHGLTRGYGGSGERRYVLRSMRNRAKDLARVGAAALGEAVDVEPFAVDMARQVEARQELARLGARLQGWQRELLLAVAEGESGAAYAVSRGWHHSRLGRARARAAKILCAD